MAWNVKKQWFIFFISITMFPFLMFNLNFFIIGCAVNQSPPAF